MIAKNDTVEHTCQKLLASFFNKHPNSNLQAETNRMLKKILVQKNSMHGKPGGWAGGIIYAAANQYRRSCGIPGFLNKESEEFFGVSMSTIYKRAWTIWESLGIRGF